MIRFIAIGLVIVGLASGCAVDDSSTRAVPAGEQGQVDGAAETQTPLPFESRFPNRTNAANDGTPYEPCTAFAAADLEKFNIDYTVVEDAAQVDGQGTRGCHWFMPQAFGFGQVVANSASLDIYKRHTPELDWRPDVVIGGRTVGVFGLKDHGGTCSTYVQSYSAGVVTNILTSTEPEARTVDACQMVLDFTRAYIDKIPN